MVDSKSKRIAKNTGMLYVRMLFIMGVTLFTSRVVLHTLGEVDYGINNTVGGIVSMFTFLNGSILIATQRFLNYYLGKGDEKQLQKIFSTSVYIHFALAIVIAVLVESVGYWFLVNKLTIPIERMDAAKWVLHCSAISTFVMLISTPYNALIIAHEKMGAFAYISILEVSLKLLIVYALIIAPFDHLKVYVFLLMCVQILLRLIYGSYCKRKFPESTIIYIKEWPLFKKMFAFASWSLLSTFAWTLQSQGVNFLLNIFFGPAVNAARGIAVQVQSAIKGFSKNFQMALNPQITKSYAEGDLEYMHKLVYASSKFSFFLLFLFSVPIVLEAPFILKIWLVDVPRYTVDFMRLTLFISMFDAIFNSFMIAVQATGNQSKLQIISAIGWLFTVPVAYLFLRAGMHPQMVFVADIICSVSGQLIAVYYCKKQIDITFVQYIKHTFFRMIPVAILTLVPLILLRKILPNGWSYSIIMMTISVLFTAFIIYIVGLNSHERTLVNKKLVSNIKRKKC